MALTILGTTACQTGDASGSPSEQRRAFTGEQVFEGVFFGVGPVAELVPELFAVDPELLNEADRDRAQRTLAEDRTTPDERAQAFTTLETDLFSWIRAVDPTFIERFGEGIQSGDHLEIDEMLDESITVLAEVRNAHPDALGGLTDAGRGTGLAWNDAVIYYQAWFYWPPLHAWAWWGGGTDKQRNPLARERTVDLLSERLAVESFD